MSMLHELVPDPDVLLALAPEALAPLLLKVARSQLQNGVVSLDNVSSTTVGYGMAATRANRSTSVGSAR
jgi:hypothetical protein